MADGVQFLLERHRIKFAERQTDKQGNAPVELIEGFGESLAFLIIAAFQGSQ